MRPRSQVPGAGLPRVWGDTVHPATQRTQPSEAPCVSPELVAWVGRVSVVCCSAPEDAALPGQKQRGCAVQAEALGGRTFHFFRVSRRGRLGGHKAQPHRGPRSQKAVLLRGSPARLRLQRSLFLPCLAELGDVVWASRRLYCFRAETPTVGWTSQRPPTVSAFGTAPPPKRLAPTGRSRPSRARGLSGASGLPVVGPPWKTVPPGPLASRFSDCVRVACARWTTFACRHPGGRCAVSSGWLFRMRCREHPVQASVRTRVLALLGFGAQSGIAGSPCDLWEELPGFSTAAAPPHVPTSRAWGLPLLHRPAGASRFPFSPRKPP